MQQTNNESKAQQIIAWSSTFLTCLFLTGLYYLADFVIATHANMLAGMGTTLPVLTRIVLNIYGSLPVPFVAAGVLVLGKELVIRDKKRSLVTTLFVAVVMLLSVGFMSLALYLPLLKQH